MTLTQKAYEHLTEKQQTVWILVMQDCLTEREAAKKLGLTRDCVHDRLNKARRSFVRFVKEAKKL